MSKVFISAFTLCLILVLYVPVQAQEKTPVTVYLKNGKSIHGAIISSIFDEYLAIEIDEVTHLDIHYDKIKMIVFGMIAPEEKEIPAKVYEPRTGFTHTANIGLLIGQNEGSSLSLNMVNGYHFASGIQAGLGIGLDFHGNITSLPVYAQLKTNLTRRKVTPYVYLNTGYGFAWANNESDFIEYDHVKGSWMMQPGFGYRFNMKSMALLVGLGYRLQKVTLDYTNQGWGGETSFHEERTLRRFALSLGISF